ncbi:MAG: hypothetical protein ABI556_15140, partial [Gemmatimonadales bacterium]
TLVFDTIAFDPYSLGSRAAGFDFDAEGLNRLVARNIETLKGFAIAWTRAAPDDPDAQESLANVLESAGKIGGAAPSALNSIRAARQADANTSTDDGAGFFRKVRLANTNVRLLLKLSRFSEARILADSAVSWKAPSALDDSLVRNTDGLLSGLLALTGKARRVIALEQKYAADYPVRLSSGETLKLPGDLGAEVLRLSTYSAFGSPRDSIVALDARIRENLESLVPSSKLAEFRVAVLQRPLSLSLDVIGTKSLASLGPSDDPFISAVRAVDAGNRRLARKLADSLAVFRAVNAPGEVTMDVVLQEAWLRAAIGDSSIATRSLDRALRGLSRAPTNLLEGAELSTALVRAMLMRSDLAAATGDDVTHKKWSAAVRELWTNADPHVRARAQNIARSK